MKLINFLSKIYRRIISFLVSFLVHKDSFAQFTEVYSENLGLYKKNKDSYNYLAYVQPQWKENTDRIIDLFVNNFTFSFLRNQVLKRTMFAHLSQEATLIQKNVIRSQFGSDKAKYILQEHSAGSPILNDFEFSTSGNSIHHLYHLAKFEKETGASIQSMKSCVELGGGYGNLAKIVKKITPATTYTIIDIPIFSYIQLVYLQTIFGKDEVILFNPTNGIIPSKINIVPFDEKTILNLSNSLQNPPDLFISTWALSESNQATQKLVEQMSFFNSTYLLLAYQKANQEFAYAEDLKQLVKLYEVNYNAETEYLNDNYYLFASIAKS